MFYSKKNIAAAALFALIAGCGFEPLYVEKKTSGDWYYDNEFDTGIIEEMASVKIELIQDRIGQLIRNDLLDMLTPLGQPKRPKYLLMIDPQREAVYDQALRNDITATRKRVEYTVAYTMYEDGKEIVKGNSVAYGSYDILANPYSMTIAQKKVMKDSAQIIANDISLRIGAYFHSRITKKGSTSDL